MPKISRSTTLRRTWWTALAIAALVLSTVAPASAALPDTQTPVLTLDHLIVTKPFAGSTVSIDDNEGSAYVPQDNSLWLADDDARRIYEIDATTGALKQVFDRSTFENLPQSGGGPAAGTYRDRDFESLAYDAATDTLYAFSGSCCTASNLPTAFRFQRVNGQLEPIDYQPLPDGSDFTAAAWNSAEGKLYVGVRSDIQTYDYATNTTGPVFHVSGLGAIEGFDFSADGKDLFVARSVMSGTNPYQLLSRVNWTTKTLVSGWTFDLSPFGVMDARGVALINDQFYVSDGYDYRTAGDPMDHAVFVFDVSAQTGPVVAPTAAFTATQEPTQPYSMKFTDTSLDAPTSWQWNFGDGGSSTLQNPRHVYAGPGTYKVSLTASNSAGKSTVTQDVVVLPPLTASFTATPTSGTAPLNVAFTDTSTGSPTSWSWDFGDGGTSTQQNPTHTFTTPGDHTVVLTVTSLLGQQTSSQTVSVAAPPPAPTASFTASSTSGTAPLNVAFTDTSTGSPTSWSWDFGDGGTSTQQNPTHTFTTAGDHTVTLTAKNAQGSDQASKVISVAAPPPAPTASFTASRLSGAAPMSVRFADTSTGAPTKWSWDFGDGATSTDQNPAHTFAKPGRYTVTLTAGNAQGSDTSSVVIRARDLTAPTGRYTDRPWRAHVGRTHVAIVQRWLRDDFTPTRAIRRVVRWGDGKTTTWRRGTTVEHVYRKRGIFHPRVIITDRAGNHRVLSLHRIVVRR